MNSRRMLIYVCATLLPIGGCASTTTVRPEEKAGFGASAGTLSYAGAKGLSLLYLFDIDEVPADGQIEVSVAGPNGWNNGDILTTTSRIAASGENWSWHTTTRELVDGQYTVSTEFGREAFSKTLEVTASNALGIPDPQVVLKQSDLVSFSWPTVPDAASYYVQLYSADDTLPRGSKSDYTRSNSYTFSGLSLPPGKTYYVSVQAMSADFSNSDPQLPQGQFNASFKAVSFVIGE